MGNRVVHQQKRVLQVTLQAPASADQPLSSWFIAVGVGVLVSEDWASAGSVTLLSVDKERVQSGGDQWEDIWKVEKAFQREFSGPVTAVAASDGNLIIGYGHNVRSRLCICMSLCCSNENVKT